MWPTSNPMMQILAMMKNGQNPQQIAMSMLESQAQQSDFGKNLMNLVKNNRQGEIEQIARNIAQQKGINYDVAIDEFMKQLGLK